MDAAARGVGNRAKNGLAGDAHRRRRARRPCENADLAHTLDRGSGDVPDRDAPKVGRLRQMDVVQADQTVQDFGTIEAVIVLEKNAVVGREIELGDSPFHADEKSEDEEQAGTGLPRPWTPPNDHRR